MNVPDLAGWPSVRQSTVSRPFTLCGRGLHTGRRATVTVSPAAAGEGIVFLRVRRAAAPERIPALWTHAVRRPLCTALAVGTGLPLLTVEHLLSALAALEIDNAAVTVDGDELPIFDGSALPWCDAILAAGRHELDAPRRSIRLLRTVEVAREHRLLRLEPADRLTLDVGIALMGFGPLGWSGAATPERFVAEIAPARSFGRLKWALPLKLYSLVKRQPVLRGAGFGTTAVLWGGRVLGGMRVPDEPVRHRVLDLLGDLSLAGLPILARVTARHVGHEINGALVAKLMGDPGAWAIEPPAGATPEARSRQPTAR